MDLEYEKLIAAILLLLLTFFASTLPLMLVKKFRIEQDSFNRSRYSWIISFLSCFGGGVFLATCLLHLLPDVETQMDQVFQQLKLKCNYPVSEFLLAFGFLTVLVAEQIVLNCQEGNPSEKIPILAHSHAHGDHRDVNPDLDNYGTVNVEVEVHEASMHQDRSSHSILRSLLLVFALSLHSIFEGLAIGLQLSMENVIRILLAVIIHKCIIAFTLGLNLSHSKLKHSSIVKCNVLFSITSPIGIIIGSLIVDLGNGINMLITSVILQGLAAGTFLYVTFFEVIPHELNSSDNRMAKMGCLILGFGVVSMLILYLPA